MADTGPMPPSFKVKDLTSPSWGWTLVAASSSGATYKKGDHFLYVYANGSAEYIGNNAPGGRQGGLTIADKGDIPTSMTTGGSTGAAGEPGPPVGAVPDPGHPGHFLYGGMGGGDNKNGGGETDVYDKTGKLLGYNYTYYSNGKRYYYGVDYGGTEPPAGIHQDANGVMVIPGVTDVKENSGLPVGAVPDPGHPGHFLYGGMGGGDTTNGGGETDVYDANGKLLGRDYTYYSNGKRYDYGVDYGGTSPPAGIHQDANGVMVIPGVTDASVSGSNGVDSSPAIRASASPAAQPSQNSHVPSEIATPSGTSEHGWGQGDQQPDQAILNTAINGSTTYGGDNFKSPVVDSSTLGGRPNEAGFQHTMERADPDITAPTTTAGTTVAPTTTPATDTGSGSSASTFGTQAQVDAATTRLNSIANKMDDVGSPMVPLQRNDSTLGSDSATTTTIPTPTTTTTDSGGSNNTTTTQPVSHGLVAADINTEAAATPVPANQVGAVAAGTPPPPPSATTLVPSVQTQNDFGVLHGGAITLPPTTTYTNPPTGLGGLSADSNIHTPGRQM